MKKAHISVTVTYTAEIVKEVDDKLFSDMEQAQCEELDCCSMGHLADVFDYLADNVSEDDCKNFTIEIDDVYDENDD